MYVLYQHFIDQAKQQQIQKYNHKHRDYLIRSGKISQQDRIERPLKEQGQSRNRRARDREFRGDKQRQTSRVQTGRTIQEVSVRQRPIRGTGTYNFQLDQQEEHQPIPTRRTQKVQEKPEQSISIDKITIKQQSLVRPPPSQKTVTVQNDKPLPTQPPKQPQEFQEIQLVECPQNCGRKFRPQALQKHMKICQKGEKKRKVFKVKVVDQQAQQLKKQEKVNPAPKKQEIPKWKKESEQFRNQLQNKQVADDRKECPGCGRKFNQTAAEKHIPKCVQRSTGVNRKK